jgi:hypothetical protein
MEKSESIKQIAVAMIAAQSEMGPAIKSRMHPVFNGSYENINDVLGACLPVLHKHGLAPLQPVVRMEGFTFIETTIIHTSGEYLGGSLYPVVCSKPNDPQAHGSAITYAKRYALKSFLSIRTEEDDDDDGQKAMPAGKVETKKEEPQLKPKEPTQEDRDLEAIKDAKSVDILSGFKKDWPNNRWTKRVLVAAALKATELGVIKKDEPKPEEKGIVLPAVKDKATAKEEVKNDMVDMAKGVESKKLPEGVSATYATEIGHGVKKVENTPPIDDELEGL